MGILTDYTEAAMKKKVTEKLDDGSYYACIPYCPGVWANETTIEECHVILQEVLEGWLLIKLLDGDQLKPIDGISLNVTDLQEEKVYMAEILVVPSNDNVTKEQLQKELKHSISCIKNISLSHVVLNDVVVNPFLPGGF